MEEQVVTKKKNMDYTASAVKMCNPDAIATSLRALENCQVALTEIQAKIDALIPDELMMQSKHYTKAITEINTTLRNQIDEQGSYQDMALGWYAVKQRKLSKSYDAAPFEVKYPQFAPAVIMKAVNEKALTGLIKGKLLDEAQLEADGVLKISESYAYIIKV